MGCCFSRGKSAADEDNDVELSNTTNVAVTCKCGQFGSGVKSTVDPSNNYLKVEGNGTLIGSCPLDCDTAYWEVKVGDNPPGLRVGVRRFNKKKPSDLNGSLSEQADAVAPDCWLFKGASELKTGDVVGLYWDQTDLPMLSFAVNGVPVPSSD